MAGSIARSSHTPSAAVAAIAAVLALAGAAAAPASLSFLVEAGAYYTSAGAYVPTARKPARTRERLQLLARQYVEL